MKVVFTGPVMRPTVKAKEERKWVLDTINQYFDVIVEEEDEESEDESDSDESIESLSDCEDNDEIEEDEVEDQEYKSTNRIRSMLTRAAANVSSSQTNLANVSKLKQNLGSRISLGMRQSVENLSSL